MGIYCYSDFVQRNDQHLNSLILLDSSAEDRKPEEPNIYDDFAEINSKRELEYAEKFEDSDFDTEGPEQIYYLYPDTAYNYSQEITSAIIVLVPQKFPVKEIESWSLDKFLEFETYTSEHYDCDYWEFGDIAGYRNELLSNEKEHCIWWSCRFKGYWLVNFEPTTYDTFVLKKYKPKEIPWCYYELVLECRHLDTKKMIGKTKREMRNIVISNDYSEFEK